jgi:hypothetical protein
MIGDKWSDVCLCKQHSQDWQQRKPVPVMSRPSLVACSFRTYEVNPPPVSVLMKHQRWHMSTPKLWQFIVLC